ncbi:hypothetical protein ACFL6S_25400 [Candidatus Poribacteria bacterium]
MRLLSLTILILLTLLVNWAMAADKIIMVASNAPLGAQDALIKARLEGMGFEVEAHSHDEAQPVDISGAAAVFICESIGSGNIASAYKEAPIPVIICEAAVFDDMKFVIPTNLYSKNPDLSILITDPSHPVAGGLSGEVKVVTGPGEILACAGLQGDLQVVATLNGDPCLMYYEKGAKVADGSTTPARRACTFLHNSAIPLLTEDGWGLIERSVLWALGQIGVAVEPREAVTTTWGTLKTHYR